jgi:hypothetical protein
MGIKLEGCRYGDDAPTGTAIILDAQAAEKLHRLLDTWAPHSDQ